MLGARQVYSPVLQIKIIQAIRSPDEGIVSIVAGKEYSFLQFAFSCGVVFPYQVAFRVEQPHGVAR
jgi:hypothetical protein